MVVKGLTFALSHNLQLRTDGDDYLFDTIDNNGNGDEEVWALEDKSKSCSYLRISNDVHRALFGKSETVNGETISQGASFEYCFSFADFLYFLLTGGHVFCNPRHNALLLVVKMIF